MFRNKKTRRNAGGRNEVKNSQKQPYTNYPPSISFDSLDDKQLPNESEIQTPRSNLDSSFQLTSPITPINQSPLQRQDGQTTTLFQPSNPPEGSSQYESFLRTSQPYRVLKVENRNDDDSTSFQRSASGRPSPSKGTSGALSAGSTQRDPSSRHAQKNAQIKISPESSTNTHGQATYQEPCNINEIKPEADGIDSSLGTVRIQPSSNGMLNSHISGQGVESVRITPESPLKMSHVQSAEQDNKTIQALTDKAHASKKNKPMRILVIGGGPAGLLFATSVKSMLGSLVSVTVHESRVIKDESLPAPSLRWKTSTERVNRREQVVTLQSAVFSSLPEEVQTAMFPPDSFSYVWPTGGESPAHLGFPRNVRILSIENNLLKFATDIGVLVKPRRESPNSIDEMLKDRAFDFLVIADGPASGIRDHFIHRFGRADPRPFALPSKPDVPLEDTVLALRVKCHMRDPDTVVLTIAQNRFLLNAKDGDGYLYMRLTRHEVSEVRGRTPSGRHFTGCIQSQPCNLSIREDIGGDKDNPSFGCATHDTVFIPSSDPHSLLWPRVKDGLRLFNCELKAVTVFRLSMTLRPRYVAELTDIGANPPVFGALIGDAANAIHFWPGRGLNHGIYSAVALSRTIHSAVSQWQNRRFMRSADFTSFEAAMSALQFRHKDRAWRAMVQTNAEGTLTAVADIIAEAIENSENIDRDDLLDELEKRVRRFTSRMTNRLPTHPNAGNIIAQLRTCSNETLNVFVKSGPWETFLSGGPEVNMERLVPSLIEKKADQPNEEFVSSTRDADLQNPDLTGSDILSKESVKSSFRHACQFVGRTGTLAWTEAAREIQALFIRANVAHDVSIDDIFDALEDADRDRSDRIDVVEFVTAVEAVKDKRKQSVDRLGDVWAERFKNAADAQGKILCRTAAIIISRLASSMRPTRPDLVDRQKLRAEFDSRCRENGLVELPVFLEVAALVMFG